MVRTDFLTSGAITGTIHPLPVTVYARIGDLFAMLRTAAAVVGWLRAARTCLDRDAHDDVPRTFRAA